MRESEGVVSSGTERFENVATKTRRLNELWLWSRDRYTHEGCRKLRT